MFYLHVQDFVDAYIGPFQTVRAAAHHYRWATTVRGDSATNMGISLDLPPEGAFTLTPDQDMIDEPMGDPDEHTDD